MAELRRLIGPAQVIETGLPDWPAARVTSHEEGDGIALPERRYTGTCGPR
jgi:hypothetical protein